MFSKLPELPEEVEKLSIKSLKLSDESTKEYCNSKFYLPSTDCNSNLILNDLEQSNKSRTDLINFMHTDGRIFCNECNFILTGHKNDFNEKIDRNPDNSVNIKSNQSKQINEQVKINQINSDLVENNKKNQKSTDLISICSLHNPPVYQQTELIDTNLTITAQQQIHSNKSDRQILENSIVRLFIDCKLMDGELFKLHQLVQNIIDSKAGPFLFDNYSNIIVNKGLHQLKLKILNNQLASDLPSGELMFKVLIKVWKDYYQQIVPMIDCIFYKLKDRCNITIKKVSLKAFRDEIVLKLNLKDSLMNRSIPNEIKHMLLILNNILDQFPPNKNKLILESLCSLVVSPFIAFKGMYINNKPFINSSEPILYTRKKSFDVRKTSRSINAQTRQINSLNEIDFKCN